MKKLLFFFLLLPFYAIAQEDAQPIADADLIIVEAKGNPETALKQLAMLMQEKGYFIQDYNKELLNINATKISNSSYALEVRVNAYIREKEKETFSIYVFGEYNYKNGEDEYHGRATFNNSLLRRLEKNAFEEIDKLIKAYPNGTVKYSKL